MPRQPTFLTWLHLGADSDGMSIFLAENTWQIWAFALDVALGAAVVACLVAAGSRVGVGIVVGVGAFVVI